MANRHFAEIGDVWKHLPLAEALAVEPAAAYWESHAGSARYTMTPSDAREYGVGHFLRAQAGSPVLAASHYARLVQEIAPREYPGSPAIALAMLPAASFAFCDLDPESLASIREEALARGVASERVATVAADGLATLADALKGLGDAEARGLFVHLDPYDPLATSANGMSGADLFWEIAGRGARAILWYGFESIPARTTVLAGIAAARARRASAAPVWCGEIWPEFLFHDAERRSSLIGAGILCSGFGAAAVDACRRVGTALAAAYAGASVLGMDGTLHFHECADVPEPGSQPARSRDANHV